MQYLVYTLWDLRFWVKEKRMYVILGEYYFGLEVLG